jgi:hypothetical protein
MVPILLFAFLASNVEAPFCDATQSQGQSKKLTSPFSTYFIFETIESGEEESTEGGDTLLSAAVCSFRDIDLAIERGVCGATSVLISSTRLPAAPKRDPTV